MLRSKTTTKKHSLGELLSSESKFHGQGDQVGWRPSKLLEVGRSSRVNKSGNKARTKLI